MRHCAALPVKLFSTVISGGTGLSVLSSSAKGAGIVRTALPVFRRAALKRFAASILLIVIPFSAAKTSAANIPFTSVAVVITGIPPVISAARTAYRFASPRCPDRIGIQKAPFSSITRTAGSSVLFLTKGATALTAMPQAPT